MCDNVLVRFVGVFYNTINSPQLDEQMLKQTHLITSVLTEK